MVRDQLAAVAQLALAELHDDVKMTLGSQHTLELHQSLVPQTPHDAHLVKQLAVVEGKVNQILELIRVSETLVRALPMVAPKAAVIEAIFAAVQPGPSESPFSRI